MYGKGILYEELRNVLVPSRDRHDRALVFNYTKFDTGMYGRDVVHKLLPLLRPNSSHSFLFGDWVAYLNNLTKADAARIDQGYIGMLDLDFDSPVKTFLSTCLVRDFIKHRKIIIKGHEDDRDPDENCNLSLATGSR